MIFKMSKNLQTKKHGKYTIKVCENTFLKKKKYGKYTLEISFDKKLILRKSMGMSNFNKKIKTASNQEELVVLYFKDDGYGAIHDNDTQEHFISGHILKFHANTGKLLDSEYYSDSVAKNALTDFKKIERNLKNKQLDGREM